MPTGYTITFEPGGRAIDFVGSKHEYVMPDGERIGVVCQLVWCVRCGKITEGEEVPTVADLDEKISFWERPPGPTSGNRRLRQTFAAMFKQRRQWRLTRVGPPKCLTCGSAEVTAFPNNVAVPHPAGSGTVRVHADSIYYVLGGPDLLTPEGDRLPEPPPDRG